MSWLSWFWNGPEVVAPAREPALVRRVTSVRRDTSAPAEMSAVDLASLLCTALRPLILQAGRKEVRLVVAPSAEFPDRVKVDGFKLAWATTALVGNALRFVRKGTVLMPGGSIHVKLGWEPGVAVIQVIDDGPGIPPEVLEHLLDRVVAPGRVPPLQLLLIEDIVNAHRGTLEIEVPESGGTTVTMRVPCA